MKKYLIACFFISLSACADKIITYEIPPLPYGARINRALPRKVREECDCTNCVGCAHVHEKPCGIWISSPEYILHEETHCGGGDETAARKNNWNDTKEDTKLPQKSEW